MKCTDVELASSASSKIQDENYGTLNSHTVPSSLISNDFERDSKSLAVLKNECVVHSFRCKYFDSGIR